MLGWIKGGTRKLKNPEKASPEILKLLAKELSPLDALRKGLAGRLLAYVADGEDDQALLVLRGFLNAAEALQMRCCCEKPRKDDQHPVLSRMDAIPPAVLYRYVQVLHAAWSACPKQRAWWPHLPKDEEWLEVFICEALQRNGWGNFSVKEPLDVAHVTAMLEAGGHETGALANLILLDDVRLNHTYLNSFAYRRLEGLGAYLASHPKEVINALRQRKAEQRIYVIAVLLESGMPVRGELIAAIVDQAVGPAKKVREATAQVLFFQTEAVKQEAALAIREKVQHGSASEKWFGAGMLFALEGPLCREFLEERRKAEKSKRLLDEIDKYLGFAAADEGDAEKGFVIPEAKEYPENYTLSPEAKRDLVETFEQINIKVVEAHREHWDHCDPRWRHGPREIPPPASPKVVASICNIVENRKLLPRGKPPLPHCFRPSILAQELSGFVERHPLPLPALLRLGFCVDMIHAQGDYSTYIDRSLVAWIDAYRRREEPGLSLLDLASAFGAARLNAVFIERLYLYGGYDGPFNVLGFGDNAIWPYFYKHRKELSEELGAGQSLHRYYRYHWGEALKRAYRILAMFPSPPAEFLPVLWEQALGVNKTERPLAQACLANWPGKEKLIIQALGDARKEVRSVAAAWLAELKVKEAAPALRKALQEERHDEPKEAMLLALEALGEDIEGYLNRKKLDEEAEKGLAKGIPEELAWFPLERLPEVHWEKSRRLVPPETLKWFMVQSFRLKKPEPGPLLRRYFALMRPSERKALGRFVLDCWIAQDTSPRFSLEEAEREADKALARLKQSVARRPQYYPNFDEKEQWQAHLNYFLNECMNSAHASKGILAVSGASCDADAAAVVERYLKQWYGRRMPQCKALLRMLSWVDRPLAIQLILAVATRFRTRGIQKEAAQCADGIAERKRWTRDEMADRTIPDAGFERDGSRIIDYGRRRFTARLLEDFSMRLENPDGKVIKDLPPANKTEDEAEIKRIKKEFTASKKVLKQVLKFQKTRLYEAMCLGRQWPYEDWERYLNGHPIVGRYCQRLVWLAFRDKRLVASFRPMSDGSLTDFRDEALALEAGDLIQIAHQTFLSGADAAQWRESLEDYEVEPLFQQFGRKTIALDKESRRKTAIDEFEGYLVSTYKLRNRATKLGYTRGTAEDAGWFYTYEKGFPGLHLLAVIEFTGNPLPEKDRTAALRSLYFVAYDASAGDAYASRRHPLRLPEVPAVLLSEAWNDMKQMADDGPGYDPEWEKKSAY